MAVTDNYQPDKSSGNGVTTLFTGSWNVILASYMRVYWEDKTTLVQTLKVLNTHYTLVFNANGYTVTFLPGFVPPSTVNVIRARDVTKDQPDPYKTSTGYQGAVLENSFDKVTAITQGLQDQVDRSPKLALGSTVDLQAMEAPVAGKALLWNATADGIINSENDFDDIVTDAEAAAAAAAASAAAASASASAAHADRLLADADAIATAADRVQTGLDRVATAADRVQTGLDRIATGNDVTSTHADVVLTHADVVLTHADVVLTHADVVLTHADVVSTNAARDIAKAAAGFAYTYDTTTASADPGSGKLRFNNATISSATELYISETTGLAQAIAAEIATWDDSTSTIHTKLRFFKQSDPSIFVIFNVTGTLTDNGAWDTLTVAYVVGSGVFANNDVMTVQPIRTGDKGDTGAPGTLPVAVAGGTVDVITADFTPDITLADKQLCIVISGGANTVTNPTLNVDGLGARTVVTGGGQALVAGDTGLAGYPMFLEYNLANTRWELLNPAKVTEGDIVLADVTTNNASTSRHGFQAKAANSATTYYDSLGTQTNPALNAVLTGYTSGAGTVGATDTILQAVQKLNGNVAAITSPAAASQADQETATSTTTFVSPGRQQFHPSAAKAWCMTSATNTNVASFNVSSVGNTGTGKRLINFSVAFSSANYVTVLGCPASAGEAGNPRYPNVSGDTAPTASACSTITHNLSPSMLNSIQYHAFYGDQ